MLCYYKQDIPLKTCLYCMQKMPHKSFHYDNQDMPHRKCKYIQMHTSTSKYIHMCAHTYTYIQRDYKTTVQLCCAVPDNASGFNLCDWTTPPHLMTTDCSSYMYPFPALTLPSAYTCLQTCAAIQLGVWSLNPSTVSSL